VGSPASYLRRREILQEPLKRREEAWSTLADCGATCAVVHEWTFRDGWGGKVSRWLESNGARLLAVFNTDKVYGLPSRAPWEPALPALHRLAAHAQRARCRGPAAPEDADLSPWHGH